MTNMKKGKTRVLLEETYDYILNETIVTDNGFFIVDAATKEVVYNQLDEAKRRWQELMAERLAEKE